MSQGFNFRWVPGWEQLPAGYQHLDVDGVDVDQDDRVYIITRYQPRVIVYEPDGTFVRSFGEDSFAPRTHGITVGPDGAVWCVNEGDHTVSKFTPEGELLLTIGTSGKPSDTGYDGSTIPSIKGGPPFNRPTGIAVAPDGELYVADGYGNCKVHRFTADGHLIQSWGEPGTAPGAFNLPHAVKVLADGRVLVCDRENDRIQVFTREGKFVEQWTNVQRPTDVDVGPDGNLYVSELAWMAGQSSFVRGKTDVELHSGVRILDPNGNTLARVLDQGDPFAPGNLCAAHGLAVDGTGAIYVAEVSQTFRRGNVPEGVHTFQKFVRV